jgi:hypothetical protein
VEDDDDVGDGSPSSSANSLSSPLKGIRRTVKWMT